MHRGRYNGYQGRNGARDAIKIVLGVLILVLVLAVVGLLIGQRYIVYTDDGVRLELPFFQREQTPPDESAPVNVIQIPGAPKPVPEPEPESETIPESEVEATPPTQGVEQTGEETLLP